MRVRFGVLILVGAVSGCSGATIQSTPPSTVPSASGRLARASVRITIPKKAMANAKGSTRAFVSAGTGSLKIVVGTTSTVIALNVNNPACTATTGSLVCELGIAIPPGQQQTIKATTYQRADGTGPILASATVVQNIIVGEENVINLALAGIAVSALLQPYAANPYVEVTSLPKATTSTTGVATTQSINLVGDQLFAFSIDGVDASGATILQPPQQTAFTLTPESGCGAFLTLYPQFNGTNELAAQPTASFTPCLFDVSFAGGAPIASIRIGASPAIYVANANGLNVYDAMGTQLSPTYSQSGINEIGARPASVDSGISETIEVSTPNSIVALDDFFTAAAQTAATTLSYPSGGTVFDQMYGQLYVSDTSGVNGLTAYSLPNLFGPGGALGSYNNAVINGQPPKGLNGLTVDPATGIVYVADTLDATILKFDPNNASVGLQVLSNLSGLNGPSALAFDEKNQRLYIADGSNGTGTIRAYDTAASAMVQLSGFQGLVNPSGIAFQPQNNDIIVTDAGATSGTGVYQFTADGAIDPFTSANPFAGQSQPVAVSVLF